jgi:hypothetical protein
MKIQRAASAPTGVAVGRYLLRGLVHIGKMGSVGSPLTRCETETVACWTVQ